MNSEIKWLVQKSKSEKEKKAMNINDINAMKKELNELKEKANNLETMITEAEKTAEPVFNRIEKGEVYYTILTTTGGLTVYPNRENG